MTSKNQLDALMEWYGTLTPQSLPEIRRFYASEARFKDPFNEVIGVAAITHIAFYAGWPTAASGLVHLKKVLDSQ